MRFLAVLVVVFAIALMVVFVTDNMQPEPEAPSASALYSVSWLSSSDTDRVETSETISGNQLIWLAADAEWDGLGDITAVVRVINLNAAGDGDIFTLNAEVTFATSWSNVNLLNLTDLNTRFDFSVITLESGSPTISFDASNRWISKDWGRGNSDSLQFSLAVNPLGADDISSSSPGVIKLLVGGHEMVITLRE